MKTLMLLSIVFTMAFFEETYSKQVVDQVCTGDVTLSSQAEVDAFTCSEVTGNLTISGNDINNLNSLSFLRNVKGRLLIENNPILESVAGLSALDSVRIGLTIRHNPVLSDITALSSLVRVGELTIDDTKLTLLDGFSALTEIKGNLTITNNPDLLDITAFSSLPLVQGDLVISHNQLLKSINGFSSLSGVVNGSLTIGGNRSLTSLNGFKKLAKISGSTLEEGQPLPFGVGLSIGGNFSLADLEGLNALASISGSDRAFLYISGNNSLTNINGLSNLGSVSGEIVQTQISIDNNPALKNIDGLSSLSFIYGRSTASLNISNNAVLENIDGLSALRGEPFFRPILYITITQNPLLKSCGGLTPYFESLGWQEVLRQYNNGYIKLAENGSGCTVEDIVASVTQAISKFNVIDIRNGNVVTSFEFNDTLDLANPDFNNWAIQAITVPQQVGSVEFIFAKELAFPHEEFTQTTNVFPYIFKFPTGLQVGTYSINANVYSQPDKQGEQGLGLSRADIIKIINSSPTSVSGFTLINHQANAVIQEFDNEITIDLADPKFSNLMLQANTSPQQVGSVEFIFDGIIRRTDNGFPYQFILPLLTPGTHTARVEVYSKGQKQGVKGVGRTATFKVINSATIISFDVVNESRQTLMNLHDGDKINIKDPAFKTFLFRANTTATFVSKVEFFLNNRLVAVEYGFPYEVYGDRSPGDYTLEAIPYIRIKGNYYAGTSLKISFKVVSEDTGSSSQLVMNDQSNEESLLKAGEDPGVTIFPVPVDSELYIKIGDAAGKDPLITIRTIHGLTVYQDSYSKSQSINTLHLQAGVYYLQVAGHGGFQKVVKFIKK